MNVFPELEGRTDINFDKIRGYIKNLSRPVWQIDLDGTRINMWASITEAMGNITTINNGVSSMCSSIQSNGLRLYRGYYWEYASYEDICNPNNKYEKNILPIVVKALNIP